MVTRFQALIESLSIAILREPQLEHLFMQDLPYLFQLCFEKICFSSNKICNVHQKTCHMNTFFLQAGSFIFFEKIVIIRGYRPGVLAEMLFSTFRKTSTKITFLKQQTWDDFEKCSKFRKLKMLKFKH